MSLTPKVAGLLETSEADLAPSIALGHTRSAPDFWFVKERLPGRRTSALVYQQSFSHLDKLGVCDSEHGWLWWKL